MSDNDADDILEYVPKKARRLEGTVGIGLLSTSSTSGYKKPVSSAGISMDSLRPSAQPHSGSATTGTVQGSSSSLGVGSSFSIPEGGEGSLNMDEMYARRNELPDDADEVMQLLKLGGFTLGYTLDVPLMHDGGDSNKDAHQNGATDSLVRSIRREHADWVLRSQARSAESTKRLLVWER